MSQTPPQIAIIGAGIFVKSQYIPRLAEISDLVNLKSIWSRSEESARGAVEIARKVFPEVECKWGESGLNDIIQDCSILGVAVVLAGQTQVDISLKLLKAGKHVLQEKPAAATINLLSQYGPLPKIIDLNLHLWRKLMAEVGDMMSVQVIVEGSMNSSNPYFSSSWRRNFTGGFILDMGVHFIAGLRMMVGCEVVSVSAMTSHTDKTLPAPDSISSLFQLENGCSGVFVMLVSSRSPKIIWRVSGLNGTLQVERGNQEGKHGYLISLHTAAGETKSFFHPFSGVTEELKAYLSDISQANLKKGTSYEAEPRSSFLEGARDIAVLEAMLESGTKQGALVQVKKFELLV